MPRNVYHEINLHLTWQTKDDAVVLVDQVENRCHQFLVHKCRETQGVYVHAIGGTEKEGRRIGSASPTSAKSTGLKPACGGKAP